MNFSKTMMACAVAVAALSGCGGGGGDSTPPSVAQGFWQGDGAMLLVTPGGELWGIDFVDAEIAFIKGQINASGTSFNGQLVEYLGNESLAATLSGTLTAKSTLSGTATAQGETLPFSATYAPVYDEKPNIAGLSGTYSLYSGGTATITSDGSLTGSSTSGCTFTGRITADASGKNFYRLSVNFGSQLTCPLPNTAANGILGPLLGSTLIGGVTTNTAGTPIILLKTL